MTVQGWKSVVRALAPALPRNHNRRSVSAKKKLQNVERLEDLVLMATDCPTISGFVFLDENTNTVLTNNGLLDQGELGIPNAQVELLDANGNVLETTTTAADGSYSFHGLPNNGATPATTTQTITFAGGLTNIDNQPGSPPLQLFDPDLGTLTAVTISHSVTLNSTIQAQNLSTSSSAAITADLKGIYQLNGLNSPISGSAQSTSGPVTANPFDPANPDANQIPPFVLSSTDAPPALTLTDPADLAFFTQIGARTTITPTLSAIGSGDADAPGGNLLTSATTSVAAGLITITYTYTPIKCITAGNYFLEQTPLVPNLIDGKASENGLVFPNPGSPQILPITVTNVDLPNNDFGKLTTSPSPTPPHGGPGVISLARYGVHMQPTQLVVTYSGAVDPASASNPANYFISSPQGQQIPIASATFDATTNAATLIASRGINFHNFYDLHINVTGPGGNLTTVIPFGGASSLSGFTNHQGQFVAVKNGHIVGTSPTPPTDVLPLHQARTVLSNHTQTHTQNHTQSHTAHRHH